MLRLDKTAFRIVPLHYDEGPENRARWQAMAFTEKREVVLVLQQRRDMLRVWREQGRGQNQRKATGEATN